MRFCSYVMHFSLLLALSLQAQDQDEATFGSAGELRTQQFSLDGQTIEFACLPTGFNEGAKYGLELSLGRGDQGEAWEVRDLVLPQEVLNYNETFSYTQENSRLKIVFDCRCPRHISQAEIPLYENSKIQQVGALVVVLSTVKDELTGTYKTMIDVSYGLGGDLKVNKGYLNHAHFQNMVITEAMGGESFFTCNLIGILDDRFPFTIRTTPLI